MKTLETLEKEIDESKALQKEIRKLKDQDALVDFLQKNDCDASIEDFKAYLEEKKAERKDNILCDVLGSIISWI